MQQDEHPERAVGQRERPIRGGDDRVVADADGRRGARDAASGQFIERRPPLPPVRSSGARTRSHCRTRPSTLTQVPSTTIVDGASTIADRGSSLKSTDTSGRSS